MRCPSCGTITTSRSKCPNCGKNFKSSGRKSGHRSSMDHDDDDDVSSFASDESYDSDD